MKHLKSLSKSNRILLLIIAVGLVFTLYGGLYLPYKEKTQTKTVEETEESLENTAWTKESQYGEKGIVFTEFGSMMIGTFNKEKGKLTKDSEWLSYKVVRPDTLYLAGTNGTEKLVGDFTIELGEDTLTFNDVTYTKEDMEGFERWMDYMLDYKYVDGFPVEAVERAQQEGADDETK